MLMIHYSHPNRFINERNVLMKAAIKAILREFYDDGIPADAVSRDVEYCERLRAATIVKGMRRTGKTFVTYLKMRALMDEGVEFGRIVHVNFEDERLKHMTADDLHLINEIHAELHPTCANQKCWYFLDELQTVEGWEAYARRLVDSSKVQLSLTGSSSKLLSEEIATEMRGRAIPIEVFPLSFPEYVKFNGIMDAVPKDGWTEREKGILRNAMEQYLQRGGFPDVQDVAAGIRANMLQGYVDAVLYRDVLERHEVPSVQALRYTLEYLFHNFARKVSSRAIVGVLRQMGVAAGRESIADYLSYFKDAYLAYPVSIRSDSLAVKRVNPDKMYLVDTGLIRSMNAKMDQEKGWLLENLVFMTLRRDFNKIEYYVTKSGGEVDFLVQDNATLKRSLVQVSWDMSDEPTFTREMKALKDAMAETGIDDGTVVTWDDERDIDGVHIVPVWKWCLANNSSVHAL